MFCVNILSTERLKFLHKALERELQKKITVALCVMIFCVYMIVAFVLTF